MDRLDEFIEFMEGEMITLGNPENFKHLQMLEQSFLHCSPKDRIALYLNAKEFQKSKMQRTSINPNDSELGEDIYTYDNTYGIST